MTTLALSVLILLAAALPLSARVLDVQPGGSYPTLRSAAMAAVPGDTIAFAPGEYAGGEYIENLHGTAEAWITILARSQPDAAVVIRGGANAWQIVDGRFVRIRGFTFTGQTGNGLNIDDGGSFDTPSHHYSIEECTWQGIAATGNNDQLKMSGIDSFQVTGCVFVDGSPGGSSIDMVGCHFGTFSDNTFERAGSNSIQAKGGTAYIRIERNRFLGGGARAINIGGSTGLQFFRPPGTNYEAAYVGVYGNLFVGGQAPIAYVGAVNCEVVNNTIWLPEKWAIRILQETREPQFLECGDNAFRNNIVVVDARAASPTLNIGDGTRPETFLFTNNLWYNVDDPSWNGPNVPTAEIAGIVGSDPRLADPPSDVTPRAGSPAIGAAAAVTFPILDLTGRPFRTPRTIGAIEGAGPSSAERAADRADDVSVHRDGATLVVELPSPPTSSSTVSLYDIVGHRARRAWMVTGARTTIDLTGLAGGAYLLVVETGAAAVARTIVLR